MPSASKSLRFHACCHMTLPPIMLPNFRVRSSVIHSSETPPPSVGVRTYERLLLFDSTIVEADKNTESRKMRQLRPTSALLPSLLLNNYAFSPAMSPPQPLLGPAAPTPPPVPSFSPRLQTLSTLIFVIPEMAYPSTSVPLSLPPLPPNFSPKTAHATPHLPPNVPPNYPCGILSTLPAAAFACSANPIERCFFDPECGSRTSSMLGCGAGGYEFCRFCGFGPFQKCPLPLAHGEGCFVRLENCSLPKRTRLGQLGFVLGEWVRDIFNEGVPHDMQGITNDTQGILTNDTQGILTKRAACLVGRRKVWESFCGNNSVSMHFEMSGHLADSTANPNPSGGTR